MSTHRNERHTVRGRLIQAASWSVISAILLVLVVAVLIPRLAGAEPYTILTGSMEPGMPPGTLVVVKPVDASDIAVGTVITYQLESGERAVVTHRVVGIAFDGRGERIFRTQGDANNAPDPEPVRPVQVKGERWYAVPYIGHVSNAFTAAQRQSAVVILAAGLLVYAASMFTAAARGRGRNEESRVQS
jgi:signal peptidase